MRSTGQLVPKTTLAGVKAFDAAQHPGLQALDRPAVVAHAEAGDLHPDVRRAGELADAAIPGLEIFLRALLGYGAMIDADGDVRRLGGQRQDLGKFRQARVETGHKVVPGQQFETRLPGGIAEIFARPEIADAPDIGELHMALEHPAGIGLRQMALRHDALGIA